MKRGYFIFGVVLFLLLGVTSALVVSSAYPADTRFIPLEVGKTFNLYCKR